MSAIHQFVAGFTHHDAISNEAVVMRNIFRSWGHESLIFSERKRIPPELRKEAFDVSECPSNCGPDDIVILHLSIGSDVNEAFKALKCRKAILYHNVTPSHYFDLINKQTAYTLERGKKQIASLHDTAEINMADSNFNAGELAEMGYRDTKVLPLVLDLEKLDSKPDRKVLRRFDDGCKNILFVGRCAPNKKLEDILTAFSFFQKYVEPNSRFIHVGSYAGTERYYYLLISKIRELGLRNVYFAKTVPNAELIAFYKCADLFLCMSEHEGFCIPIIESMLHDLPVVAYAAAAVPETMDGAGVLFKEKKYADIAEMMGELLKNSKLYEDIVQGQRNRIERYRQQDLESMLKQHLKPLLHNG
ncbi:hypothetical protein BVX94_00935 [bacterium B17]|nr:hypothetical protein BVX94_00935 [bacterium B17]